MNSLNNNLYFWCSAASSCTLGRANMWQLCAKKASEDLSFNLLIASFLITGHSKYYYFYQTSIIFEKKISFVFSLNARPQEIVRGFQRKHIDGIPVSDTYQDGTKTIYVTLFLIIAEQI